MSRVGESIVFGLVFVALCFGCGRTPNSNATSKVATNENAEALGNTTQAIDSDAPRENSEHFRTLLAAITKDTPKLSRPDSYVGSDACKQCHPDEHSSWHNTFHRTMTQLALPGNVIGDFSDQTIHSAGMTYRVYREGDEFWAELPDPDRMLDYGRGDPRVDPAKLPLVKRRVLMTTGSHHYQTYWVGHDEIDSVLNTLPLVYLPDEGRWIPREAAFISPPNQPRRMITIWNDHCINCHSTGGNPGLTGPKTLDTSVGELGISCEACHGPGENHVAKHSSLAANPNSNSKPDLVNPKKLDHVRSSQICGQCHGVFIRQGDQGMKYARDGIQYRPGDDLHEHRTYLEFPDANSSDAVRAAFERNREFFRERWWPDGTILAGGREYTAMQRTPCFTQGDMSCLSCHSMHNSEPDDQLHEGMRNNQACTQCHQEARFLKDISSHSHHTANSSGSECMNCHMPHTSYALFKGIRNHTISSPNIESSTKHGVPNACNLCHLDQTLEWTQDSLTEWYGHSIVELNNQQKYVAASILWMLKGDAAVRAITAWHYGWAPATETSATGWMTPVIIRLLKDPYGVVRHISEASLRKLPGMDNLEYDFLANTSELQDVVEKLLRQTNTPKATKETATARVQLTERQFEVLLQQRDNRPVSIKE